MTYCFRLATTSWAVNVLPLWNLTPLRIWKVHTVASSFGLKLVASQGTTRPSGVVKVRYSPGMPENASDGPSLSRYGSSDAPNTGNADPDRAAGLDCFERCSEREIGLAHEAQERADRAGAEAEHRRAAEELLAVELAPDELVDDVVLERPRLVAAVLLDQPLGLAVHPRISLRLRALYGGRRFWF